MGYPYDPPSAPESDSYAVDPGKADGDPRRHPIVLPGAGSDQIGSSVTEVTGASTDWW